MGLEAGFDIYKKKKGGDGKVVLEKQEFPKGSDDRVTYSCGRYPVNYAWGTGASESSEGSVQATFDKELDGYVLVNNEAADYKSVLKYIPLEDFEARVTEEIENARKEANEAKTSLWTSIQDLRDEISELRALQKSCKAENEFAFDKWEDRVREDKESISDLQERLKNYDEEDFDASAAARASDMLKYMKELMKDGYTAIPYCSY